MSFTSAIMADTGLEQSSFVNDEASIAAASLVAPPPLTLSLSSTTRPDSFFTWLSRILKRCKKKDIYAIFFDPVSEDDVPGYHAIIKNPMDFATVQVKIENKIYKTLGEFADDLFLISANAMYFNAPDTEYYKQANIQREVATMWLDKACQALNGSSESMGYCNGCGYGLLGSVMARDEAGGMVCKKICDIIRENPGLPLDSSVYEYQLNGESGMGGENVSVAPSAEGDVDSNDESRKRRKLANGARGNKRPGQSRQNAKSRAKQAKWRTKAGDPPSFQGEEQFFLESLRRLMTGGGLRTDRGMGAALSLGKGMGLLSDEPPLRQIREDFTAAQKPRGEIPVPTPTAYAESLYRFLIPNKQQPTERMRAVSRLPHPFDRYVEVQLDFATMGAPNQWSK